MEADDTEQVGVRTKLKQVKPFFCIPTLIRFPCFNILAPLFVFQTIMENRKCSDICVVVRHRWKPVHKYLPYPYHVKQCR